MLSECAQPGCVTIVVGTGFCIDCEKEIVGALAPKRPVGIPLQKNRPVSSGLKTERLIRYECGRMTERWG